MSKRLYAISIPDHLSQEALDRVKDEAKRMIANETGENAPSVVILCGGATMAVFDIEGK